MSHETTRDVETRRADTGLYGSWRTLLAGGVLIALLGVAAIVFPFVTGLSISIFLGAALVVGAVVHGAHAFTAEGWRGSMWQIVLGVVYLLAGVALLVNPVVGLLSLTLLLIAYFLVDGIVEIALGLRLRGEPRWGWLVASGAISVVLAALLWADFPTSAVWAVGLLFGISLLTTGVSMAMVAMTGRDEATATDTAASARGA
ncbi:HdeD family acid-resistance protein [Halomarina ordinaria]|uniref:HdeD family acid-resistance protein n=1 Tax=Halomarina ordinaria TaxID=3033939 RepID=A0ABD5U7F6_9EURY|nr:HdeD family acid-resistance protein [Halomarina sp. PSRA2]